MVYTLALADWQSVFQASTSWLFGLQLSSNSVTTASPMQLNNEDPATVMGPDYNSLRIRCGRLIKDATRVWQFRSPARQQGDRLQGL
jgi:hypothetical protein